MQIKITQKPFHISANARVLYKLIELLLILYFSRGKKASLLKIHLLIWVLERRERREVLLKSKESGYEKSIGLWSSNEYTNKALLYLFEDGLCSINKKTYALTDDGKEFIEQIIKDKEVFIEEKSFLKTVTMSLTEAKIEKLKKIWMI